MLSIHTQMHQHDLNSEWIKSQIGFKWMLGIYTQMQYMMHFNQMKSFPKLRKNTYLNLKEIVCLI